MLCASGRHDRVSLHGTECGVRGNCLVPKLCRGTCSALPPLPAALPAPARVRQGVQAHGAPQGCMPQGGRRRPGLSARKTGRQHGAFLTLAFPWGPTHSDGPAERSGAAVGSTAEPSVPERVSRCGSRGRGSSRSPEVSMPPCGLLGGRAKGGSFSDVLRHPTAGDLRLASAPAHGRDSLSLSLCEQRPARERPLGFRPDAWTEGAGPRSRRPGSGWRRRPSPWSDACGDGAGIPH